jgi:hypothetical protein
MAAAALRPRARRQGSFDTLSSHSPLATTLRIPFQSARGAPVNRGGLSLKYDVQINYDQGVYAEPNLGRDALVQSGNSSGSSSWSIQIKARKPISPIGPPVSFQEVVTRSADRGATTLHCEADLIQNTKRHFEPDDQIAFDEAHLVPWGAALELVMRTIARMLARLLPKKPCLVRKLRGISHFWLYLPVDQSVS